MIQSLNQPSHMTHGSLFDGAGGLRLGFEQAGVRTSWTVELLNGQDIKTLDPGTLEQVDVISGGPPCQEVSISTTLHGSRSEASLWPEMLRVVIRLRPRWVVVEQPKGGRKVIIGASQHLQRLGYGCAGRVVNSRHWVPQWRTRWLLTARLGVEGMDLWNHLHLNSYGMEAGELCEEQTEGVVSSRRKGVEPESYTFDGNCTDCMRGGVFARISERVPALVGAGNAVTVPVAAWLARKIVRAEREIG